MEIFLALVLGYLFGSISFGKIISWLHKEDITKKGSGNIGATNVARVLGVAAGIVCLFLDIFKGFLPIVVTRSIFGISQVEAFLVGMATIFGHCFPIFLKFKGGKAVSTTAGVILGMAWTFGNISYFLVFLCLLAAWAVIFVKSRIVSSSSIFAAWVFPFFLLIFKLPREITILSFVVTATIILRHRENIKRIVNKTESYFRFRRKKKVAAFIVHPMEKGDVVRKYKFADILSEGKIIEALPKVPPRVLKPEVVIRSKTGASITCWFIAATLLPVHFESLPEEEVIQHVLKAIRRGEKLGASSGGLGALTATIGDNGREIDRRSNIPLTTGNTCTVAAAIESLTPAARKFNLDLKNATLAIVGASGSIGQACAQILAAEVKNLILVGRSKEKLEPVLEKIEPAYRNRVSIETNIKKGISTADIIVSVTSAADAVIYPDYIKPGAIVCDVARPRDVAREVMEVRDDVLVYEGGIFEVYEQDVKSPAVLGLPSSCFLACMVELFILSLEGIEKDGTIGRDIDVKKVRRMLALTKKHGFRISPQLRFADRVLSEEEIKRRYKNAQKAKSEIAS